MLRGCWATEVTGANSEGVALLERARTRSSSDEDEEDASMSRESLARHPSAGLARLNKSWKDQPGPDEPSEHPARGRPSEVDPVSSFCPSYGSTLGRGAEERDRFVDGKKKRLLDGGGGNRHRRLGFSVIQLSCQRPQHGSPRMIPRPPAGIAPQTVAFRYVPYRNSERSRIRSAHAGLQPCGTVSSACRESKSSGPSQVASCPARGARLWGGVLLP